MTIILNEVHSLVQSAEESLSFCRSDVAELPPHLDLSGNSRLVKGSSAEDYTLDRSLTQFRDSLCWDVINSESDPGQAVALQKYVPVDLLVIPKKATTRDEAVTAIRMCDRQCSLIENQSHCIKNKKFLIAAVIEHVFTQVVPVPKPRGVALSAEDLHVAARSKRREEAKLAEEKQRAIDKKKKADERKAEEDNDKKSGKVPKKTKSRVTSVSKDATTKDVSDTAILDSTIKYFGDVVLPDFDAGKVVENRITDEECMWDQPIEYELQVYICI